MTTPREALKACPFCGGKAKRIDVEDGENAGGSCICCTVCNATGNLEFGFKENFVDNWNRRTTPAENAALRASEAAAWARVKVLEGAAHRLLSATQCFDHPDTPKSVADAYVAHMSRPEELLRAALTPTADKEPK